MTILILTNDINEINMLQNIFQKNSILNFTHELNKNNKISFLDVLIKTNNNIIIIIASLPLLTKKPTNNNSYTLNFESEYLFRYIF